MNEKIVPYRLGFFTWLFIICCTINFIGLTPYTFTPSRSISLTLGIAICVWVFIELGFIFKAIKRFLAHLVPSGTPDVLIPLIVVIELVRNFIRPITLSVRLAANIVAGHLLIRLVNGGRLSLVTAPIIVLSGMVLIVLEVSVAFIQGYVFSTLRVIYFSELNSALAANKS
jgi:F-type H+-transporting ATPase subunit a